MSRVLLACPQASATTASVLWKVPATFHQLIISVYLDDGIVDVDFWEMHSSRTQAARGKSSRLPWQSCELPVCACNGFRSQKANKTKK